MIRLLCLVSAMNAGGAETFLMKIYRCIDKTRFQMDFCVNTELEGLYDSEILELGGRIYHIPSKSENIGDFSRKLYGIIHDNGYKNVLRITSNAFGFLDLKIAKRAGASVCIARSSNSSDGGRLKSRLAHLFGRVFLKKYVDVKIAPSMLAAVHTFGKKDIKRGQVKILHNGIDLDVYKFNRDARERIRNEFSIDNNKFVIGHIGRFVTQKNHRFLIDIFETIIKQNKNSVLFLCGNGELEEELKNLVFDKGLSDSVIFAGIQSDIPAILSAMDVFVFPSFYEGMPNAVIEAQATGLPCIISDTITREADITGLIRYVSLLNIGRWVSSIEEAMDVPRKDVSDLMENRGYGIASVVRQFEQLVFSNV